MTAARFYSSTAGAMELQADITSSATSMIVDSTTGLPGTTPFVLVIDPGGTEEIVDVTGVAGTTLTITRAVDGSPAQAHSAGASIRHMATARDFRDAQEHIGASANVHGLTGGSSVVGTDTVQTLKNKTAQAASAATVGLYVKGFASQTAPYMDVQDSAGTSVVTVVPGQDTVKVAGTTAVNSSSAAAIYHYVAKFTASDASAVAQILKAAASQTADLMQVQNSSGTVVAKFDSAGKLTTPQVTSSGPISGTAISGTTGSFSGAVSGTSGTFTGQVQSNGINVATLTETQTLTNKTLTAPVTTGLTGDTGVFSSTVRGTGFTNGTVDLFNPPRAHIVQNTATSMTDSTWTVLGFDHADIYDTDNMHDPAVNPSRLIFKTAGLYEIHVCIGFQASAAGIRMLRVRANGGGVEGVGALLLEDRRQFQASAWSAVCRVDGMVYFNANDYIESFGWQNTGSTITSTVNTYFTYMQARWVAPS